MLNGFVAFFDHPWSPSELVAFAVTVVLLGLGLGSVAVQAIDRVLAVRHRAKVISIDEARRQQLNAMVKGRAS